MAVKYGKKKQQPGKEQGESIFAAARKERKEKEKRERNEALYVELRRRQVYDAKQHILHAKYLKFYYNNPLVTLYSEAAQQNPDILDMSYDGEYYHYAVIKRAS